MNKILFSHYRLENGCHISRPQCANTLLLKQNRSYFADDILIHIFEFILLLHMQLPYLKMNLKSWSAKYRPYCLCLDVLTRCGSDKMTSILKTTFSISFMIYSNKFSCMELFHYFFFKFDLSAFLNFHTEIYCIILTSCSERGSNAVHRI